MFTRKLSNLFFAMLILTGCSAKHLTDNTYNEIALCTGGIGSSNGLDAKIESEIENQKKKFGAQVKVNYEEIVHGVIFSDQTISEDLKKFYFEKYLDCIHQFESSKNKKVSQAGQGNVQNVGNGQNVNSQNNSLVANGGSIIINNNYEGFSKEQLTNMLQERDIQIDRLNNKLAELTIAMDPFKQPLRTGTATVEIVISSKENLNAHFMDSGGYIAFGKGNQALLVMSSIDSFGNQIGNGQVIYKGIFNLDAANTAVGKPISYLTEADYAQIGFKPIAEKSKVIRGSVICTFNSAVQIKFIIPEQQMSKDFIMVPDIKKAFTEYVK